MHKIAIPLALIMFVAAAHATGTPCRPGRVTGQLRRAYIAASCL